MQFGLLNLDSRDRGYRIDVYRIGYIQREDGIICLSDNIPEKYLNMPQKYLNASLINAWCTYCFSISVPRRVGERRKSIFGGA